MSCLTGLRLPFRYCCRPTRRLSAAADNGKATGHDAGGINKGSGTEDESKIVAPSDLTAELFKWGTGSWTGMLYLLAIELNRLYYKARPAWSSWRGSLVLRSK